MAPKARFADGEKVLCFHGPLLYEAKCLKSQLRDKHMKYFIHYSGWNKNWDEWVPECRVLKYNDTNLEKQKELNVTHTGSKRGKGAKFSVKKEKEVEKDKETVVSQTPSTEKPKVKVEKREAPSPLPETPSPVESPVDSKKKKKPETCFVEDVKPEVVYSIHIPELLKNWLIDDWDLINRQKKILYLPARITVDHIIAAYVKEKVSAKGLTQSMENNIVLFANNIRDCFNVSLGNNLLYKFERPQYGEMLLEYNESNMCQIYGGIHLLRMFTNMAGLLMALPIKREDIFSLIEQVEDFAKFISQNSNFFSLNDYVVASPEYHRRAL